MPQQPLKYYVNRYQEGTITPEEWEALRGLLRDREELDALMDQEIKEYAAMGASFEEAVAEIKREVLTGIRPRVRKLQWWAVAASVVLLVGAGWYLLRDRAGKTSIMAEHEVPPGREGAILTLADGTQVSLDTIRNGVVALQGGVTARVVNGMLSYTGTGNETVYNTVSTPKGRQFHMTLPDGTEVWLNAASSIYYPTAFNGKDRSVKITGEAYFEVTENSKMPFRVNIDGKATIQVLGTHFNVQGYDNEKNIVATLLEGSVQVNDLHEGKVVLQPGQQAQISTAGIHVTDADGDKALAWKNGTFNFNDASLEEAMRQLERWYDIEVVYEKGIPDIPLFGEVRRDLSLSQILKGLESIDVHFRVEGRKVTVTQ